MAPSLYNWGHRPTEVRSNQKSEFKNAVAVIQNHSIVKITQAGGLVLLD